MYPLQRHTASGEPHLSSERQPCAELRQPHAKKNASLHHSFMLHASLSHAQLLHASHSIATTALKIMCSVFWSILGGHLGGHLGGQLGGQLEKSAQKVEKCHPRNLSPKNVLGKMQQVCMEAPRQPSKTVFRLHETTVFRNGPGPSKVEKLIQKAALLDLILAPKMDLAGEKVVARWVKGG